MYRINKYKNLLFLGGVLLLAIFLYTLYEKRVQTLHEEYLKLQVTLVKEYVEERKLSASHKIQRLKKTLYEENKRLEEKATYELKQKVDRVYESLHALSLKHKKKKSIAQLKESSLDLIRYGVDCGGRDEIFVSNFDAELLYTADKTKEKKNYSLYTDADGRNIALEMIQKVRKYSETYIYTNTHEGIRKLIYAKNLDIYDWFVGASLDLSKRSMELQAKFVDQSKDLAQGSREFVALYDKKKGEFLYQQAGDAFDATHIEAVTSNLLPEATWYTNTIDSNYYYSDSLESLDLYIIYGFAIKKLIPQL